MKLFDVAKVGCYLESISHSTEKRKDGEQKVLQLSIKVDPFDVKLATALHPAVRATLFKAGTAEPFDHLRKVEVALGTVRQQMTIFATPDTVKGSILLDHVRISKVYARTSKDARGYVLVFQTIFGPPDARELEYCELWRNNMAFVTFTEAEASDLFVDESDEDEDDEPTGQQSLPDPDAEPEGAKAPLNADTDRATSRQRELDHRARQRHEGAKAKRAIAKKPKAKGRGRR